MLNMSNKIVRRSIAIAIFGISSPAFIAAINVVASATASADVISASPLSVAGYYALGDYGNGDTVFQYEPSTALTGCDGGWIAPSQPAAKNLFATMIAAKLSGSNIRLYVDNADIWPGSGARYCKVYLIGLL